MEAQNRIMVIDDDKITRESLKFILEEEGYEAETAKTGRGGVEKMHKKFFNITLLDNKLPDVEGTELLISLKEMHPEMDIIMITGNSELDSAIKALNRGASAYVLKPLDIDGLLRSIKGFLEKQSLIAEKRQVERELKESQEKYQFITENANDIISVFDHNMNLIFINETYQKISGFSRHEIMGKGTMEFVHPDDYSHTSKEFRKLIRTGKGVVEFRMRCKDNSYIWVETNGKILIDDESKELKMLLVSRDIDEKKKLELNLRKSEEKYRGILENMHEGYFEVDLEGTFTFFNDSFCKNVGYSRNELLGANFRNYINEENKKKLIEVYKNVYETGIPVVNFLFRCTDKSNEEIICDSSVYLRHDSYGNKIGFSGIVRNVSEKSILEQKVKESEERFRIAVDNANDAIYIHDLDGNFLEVNRTAITRLGYPREVLLQMKPIDLNPPGVPPTYSEGFKEFFQKQHAVTEATHMSKDGKIIPIELSSNLIQFKGEPAIITISRDITDRKKAEENLRKSEKKLKLLNIELEQKVEERTKELKESEERYKNIIENMSSGVAVYTAINNGKDFIIKDFNKAGEQISKVKRVDIINKNVIDVFPGVIDFGLHNVLQRVWKTGNPEQYPTSLYQDERISLWTKIYVFKLSSGEVVAVYDDLTEMKRAEQNLMESEEKFRSLVNNLTVIILEVDLKGKVTYVSYQSYNIMGYQPTELIGKSVFKFIYPEDTSKIGEAMKKALKTKKATTVINYRILHKNGSIIFASATGKYVNVNGSERFIVAIRDITEEKEVERRLIESEEKYRNIINNISDALMEGTVDGTITFVSPQIYNIIGYRPNELIGFKFLEFTHLEDKNLYESLLNDPQKAGAPYSMELRILHKKGYYVPISARGSLEEVNGKLKFFIVIRNITEQRKIDNMMKSEIKKLLELDQIRSDLIRRISHELKTPLISIFNGSQYLLEHIGTNNCSDQVQDIIKLIHRGGYRLRSLVNNLIIAYNIESDDINLNLKKENLIPIIKNCVEDLAFQANKRKNFINLELLKELYIEVDKSMIKRAISNILSNAVKNTPTNGNIFLSTFEHPKYIDIIVKDDGVGLTKKEISLLFKKFGKIERYGKGMDVDIEGAGLGLYIANEIAKLHNGEIIVKSKGRNEGSTFTIRLHLS